jgi:hypothetical protein
LKYFKLFLALIFTLFCISNAFADNQRCRKIIFNSEPDITIYSDNSDATYFPLNRNTDKCNCTIGFNLQSNEQYIGTSFNGKILDRIILSDKDADIAKDNKYWNRNEHIYYKYWIGTLNYLESIVDNYKRCPNEDEYQELKSIYLEEKNIYKKMVDAKREEVTKKNALHEQENAARLNLIKKFCNGVPKINLVVIENISFVVKVDPQLIKLNRANIADNGNCFATFHTPKGVVVAWVDFNQNGVITSNGKIFFNQ